MRPFEKPAVAAHFRFEGNRALVFERDAALPKDSLALCIAAALTYHRRRRP
jgi:hypothetical protein